ncbi:MULTISPECIES: NUDIX domain-containing protein [Lacticaseibacillus]|uniref:ADP-ribose pyrophosphatase n=1 Tax=Lacticaseibacillus casei DSM 20011 = JCM 1134 = ATCC 393 TaxID=1423732 RepID=A0AAD1ALN0_LACCA|nr:NUDIX domain-containing protein [Lacticaseibacillus casei]MBI6598936.1 NUDIX domain-containing protein [Lacticaseibacillus casei]MBO1482606.1 NUDIX domain-containing protein [Lacticaseibacillus casei]MBO2417894.1 NUDIX domain-containing protein [Lacticaseibacillus casei]MCK2082268.1 NUDIX domain-containing protein [Lacticaseibacillus casei]MED7632011.1 NUDIX domain-containing protein [Lacticaseibacillus casei]
MVEVHFETVPQRPDSVLVVQSFNAGIIWVHNSKRRWELTGGKLEAGETLAQAAVRESFEESGAVIKPDSIVPLGYYVLPTGHVTAVVRAEVDRLEPIPASSETDDRKLLLAPLPDADRSFHDDVYCQIFRHIGWPDE